MLLWNGYAFMTENAAPPSGGSRLFPFVPRSGPAPLAEDIYAVAGGKGGIGKSLVAASLAIAFARAGRRVLLVDADLGCPNLHTCLGLRGSRRGLGDFLKGRVESLDAAGVETGVENLTLVSGLRDTLSTPNLTYFEKQKIIQALHRARADVIFVDLSAGSGFNTVDLFLAATKGVLVAVPEPTAIENLYRFLRAAVHRRLASIGKDGAIVDMLNEAEDMGGPHAMKNPADLIERVRRGSPEAAAEMERALARFDLRVLLNQVRGEADEALAGNLVTAIRHHLGLRAELLGAVSYDVAVWQCVSKGKVLLEDYPRSRAAQDMLRAAERLGGREEA